ncbi:MAG: ABC transporter permease [Propionibacterium sp.]|nr:MAG: ABC transporter permease [Propionibacterium sp.]
MNQFEATMAWLADAANWGGPDGIWARIAEHLYYSGLALFFASLIAIPLGIFIGHTGRGRTLVVVLSGAIRALPTLGLLTLLALSLGLGLQLTIVPATIVLSLLAVPTLLAATYSGIEAVDDDVVDGARASGFAEGQIITKVELALAAPIILGGIRSAVLQILATATVSAYLGLGGLGRLILDGLALTDYPRMLGGAIVVSALALIADGVLLALERLLMPRGVQLALGQRR